MKINICFNKNNTYLNNYINTNIDNGDEYLKCDLEDLSAIVDNGEAEEILAINVLNYVSHKKLKKTVLNWYKKLSYNGILTIYFLDFIEICRLITVGSISYDEAKNLLFGIQDEENEFFKSGISLLELKSIFEEVNGRIESCKKDGIYSLIKVRRVYER